MRKAGVAKVTISLRRDLLKIADRMAKEKSTTRSGVVAALLQKEEQARIRALMEEGYREMAEENRRMAEEAFPYVSQMILSSTRWDEDAND